jgi:hypothetical protein
VVPTGYHDFLVATASASGALVGLLFVAISVAPEPVVGPKVSMLHQIRASSAITALLSPLILALIALIPGANIGYGSVVVGLVGLLYVATAIRRLITVHLTATQGRRRAIGVLIGFALVMGFLTLAGVRLLLSPHDTGALAMFAGSQVASLSIGVNRAWELVGARDRGVTALLRELVSTAHDDEKPPSA